MHIAIVISKTTYIAVLLNIFFNSFFIRLINYIPSRKIASKYDEDSWQRYIIANKLKDKISDMLRTKDKDPESYAIYKEEYDKIMFQFIFY